MRYKILLAALMLLLASVAFANKKKDEAAALINRAKQLSDIRADGSPPFQLRAESKITEVDGSSVDGEYTEIWLSKAQWRRDIVFGNFRRTEVAAGRKLWTADSDTKPPDHLDDVLRLLDIRKIEPTMTTLEKVKDQQVGTTDARCLEFAAYTRSYDLCFDRTSGALVADMKPSLEQSNSREVVCSYTNYQKFGERVFARSYECDEDGRATVVARILELSENPDRPPAAFAPPDGAKESVNCFGATQQPTVLYQEGPKAPPGAKGDTVVMLNFIVGVDGLAHDPKVTSAPNGVLDDSALRALKRWRFHPATCDGQPIAAPLAIVVTFHFFY